MSSLAPPGQVCEPPLWFFGGEAISSYKGGLPRRGERSSHTCLICYTALAWLRPGGASEQITVGARESIRSYSTTGGC